MMEKSKKVVILQFVELLVIVFAWGVKGSAGPVLQSPLASLLLTSAAVPPMMEGPKPSLPLHSPMASPPLTSASPPPTMEETVPSSPLHFPVVSPPYSTASPPLTVPVQVPSLPPSSTESKAPPNKTHVPVPVALAPVAPSSMDSTQNAPATLPSIPVTLPPTAHHKAPFLEPIAPVASPPKDIGHIPEAANPNRTRIAPSISPVQGMPQNRGLPENSPAISPVVPGESPPPVKGVPPTSWFLENPPAISPVVPGESPPSRPVPGAPLPSKFPKNSPAISPVLPGESPPSPPEQGVPPATGVPEKSPASRPVVPRESPPAIPGAPPNETPETIPPVSHSPTKGSFSAVPPSMHNATRHSTVAPPPSNPSPESPSIGGHHSPASSPSPSIHKDQHKVTGPAPASYLDSPPSKHRDQVIPPAVAPKGKQRSDSPPPYPPVVPPTGMPIHYAPPTVPPTGRPTHYAPPPLPPAVPPTDRPTQYAPPPQPLAVPPTGRPTHYAPPPLPLAVPPAGRSTNYTPPFPPAVPPASRPTHHSPPPFPPTVSPTRHSPPPFPPAVSPAGTTTHHSPPPFPQAVSPAGRATHSSPPPFPPALPPTGRSTHHAPPPLPLTIPPTSMPSQYGPPPFPPAVSPKGMPRRDASPPFPPAISPTAGPTDYTPPPFLPAVSPKGMPRRYASPPLPPAVSPTAGPTHYIPSPFLPAVPPRGRPGQYAPPPLDPGSSNTRSRFPFPPMGQVSPAPSPVSDGFTTSFNPHLHQFSPSASPPKSPLVSPPPPIMTLPPPPPNEDCSGTICTEPLTNTPPGSPCACVWPMQIGLSLGVDLYTFFPLVSELAAEIAAGVFMKQSQVRIMGANAASQQPEKTVVLIDLVPMGEKFDNTTALLTFQRFWLKKVDIKKSYFGDYEVLYVRYQGLPPPPPLPPSSIGMIDDGPYSGNNNNGRTIKPLGVDVGMKRHKNGLSGSIIAIIVLSAIVVVVLCSAASWFLLLRHRSRASQQPPTPQASLPSLAKPSGVAGSMGSVPSSASLSFGSSIVTYTGSAKTYSITDIERATNNFDESRVLGEGGFGRVYKADLDDGIEAAVKVLKRDDQQGGREFLAEVEMLSRLHHRNLVKLIGICTEERARCLVYELIPNGSVESHLHGVDKESAPLDWASRMKIALGAARGLAYLHEDSSPRVIHRDFKSSNILLEHDFTPKVSDFGLARTALDEESRHISTRVMGTFGYVAPEYAMTGHLLVKSDVYSYGVVLLELLTGRKPVDMSQPPGQENLVSWARPLLTSKEGLQILTDSSLGPDVPHDSIAKVAAIASMCVQPEVSHRPFMGEVVQALKLVCNECDEAKEMGSRTSSHENLSIDGPGSGQCSRNSTPGYGSGFDPERGLSVFGGGSLRRNSSSGPLRTGRGWRFWGRPEGVAGGSVSEHGAIFRSGPGSY